MEPRVEVGAGTAIEVLIGAAAVADANWREVFTAGPATHAAAVAALDPRLVRRAAALGRFGWINLVSLLVTRPAPWGIDALITAVQECHRDDLHVIAVGGDRSQLIDAVGEAVIRASLEGDPGARTSLEAALSTDQLVIQATPWVLGSSSTKVKAAIVDVLQAWRVSLLGPAREAAVARSLQTHVLAARDRLAVGTSREFLEAATGGVHYDPAALDRVLAISSEQVAPIIVVVDGRMQTVIVHPPLDQRPRDEAGRLLELSRAVGDKTRVRVLTELRAGEMTAIDLARALGAPRTTLLHHLAILRSAGMIHVSVAPGGATIYRLRPEGLGELSTSAARFIPTE